MNIHAKKHLMLPLLVLSLSLAMTASAQAQDRHDQGSGNNASASLQITFGSTPHWTGIRGTRVREIRQGERPNYDMFRYGGSYYVYNNDRWYSSRQMRGGFTAMDDRAVPSELRRVPRGHWHNYPSGWSDQNNDPRRGREGQRH